MDKAKKANRVLVLSTQQDCSYGRYVHITGFVSHASDKENGFDGQRYGADSEILELSLSSQGDDHSDEFYGMELGYSAHDHVTMYQAQKALKLLAPIERKLAKMYEVEGNPQNIGAWINRVARATNCTRVFIFSKERKQKTGQGYQSYSVGDAVYAVNVAAGELLAWAKALKQAA